MNPGCVVSDLEADLLATSEALYHQEVARFQLRLQEQRMAILSAFTDSLSRIGGDGLNAIQAILERDQILREQFMEMRQRFVAKKKDELEQRNRKIRTYCLHPQAA